MTKRCNVCDEYKLLGDFHRDRGKRDGLCGSCKSCNIARAQAYRDADPKRWRETSRAWSAAHPEQKAATDRAYREANVERITAQKAAVRRAVKLKKREGDPRVCERCALPIPFATRTGARFCSERCRKRDELQREHAVRRGRIAGCFVEHVERLVLLERDDGTCGICGSDVDPLAFHIDHIIPLARGGEHSYANTQVAHPRCNRVKSARLEHELEWAA